MITLTAFRWVPPFAQGQVRDLRVRWALEEAGIPYREWLIGSEDLATAAYRALQPFGQVPAIETDELKLFESGAIVLHIAERCETLMPSDANGRARTIAWMFAALNSVEPPIMAGRARLFLYRRGVGGGAPADRNRGGAEAACPARGLARRPRLSRKPVHGRGSADDDRAAHPAPYRHRVGATSAEGVSGAL